MTRKTKTLPREMNARQQGIYQRIALGDRAASSAFPLIDHAGALTGPFDAMLLMPEIGDALQNLGSVIRFHGHLTDRAREIAILTVAHHHGSAFEVSAHEAVGRKVGLSDDDLEHLANKRIPGTSDEYERAVARLVQKLLCDRDLDDDSYTSAVEQLSQELVFEVNTLVGYYSLLATQLRIFRV